MLPPGLRGVLGFRPPGFGGVSAALGVPGRGEGRGWQREGRKKQTVLSDVLGDPGGFVFVWGFSPPLFLSRAHITTASALVSCKVGILRASRPNLRNALIFFCCCYCCCLLWSMFNNFVRSRDFIRQIMSKEFPLLRGMEIGERESEGPFGYQCWFWESDGSGIECCGSPGFQENTGITLKVLLGHTALKQWLCFHFQWNFPKKTHPTQTPPLWG